MSNETNPDENRNWQDPAQPQCGTDQESVGSRNSDSYRDGMTLDDDEVTAPNAKPSPAKSRKSQKPKT